jgi:hypothetical protein
MTDVTLNYVLCFTAGLLVGVFRKQIVAYIKAQQKKSKKVEETKVDDKK